MSLSRNTSIYDAAARQVCKPIGLKLSLASLVALLLAACTPTVQVAPSDKPITINMNIKIEHEIRVKLDKQLEEKIFSEDSGLF